MPTEPESSPPLIRRAAAGEAVVIAALFRRVREQNAATIPPLVHSFASVCAWVDTVLLARYDVWVADRGGEVVAMMALRHPDWLEHLYIDASARGQGLGSRLVALAKAELTGPAQLWTFQSNRGARRFYERHGFEAVQWTDGDNEEGAPDVRYVDTARSVSVGRCCHPGSK
ncbi:MAG: GNAT family N-acetyltransferase [Nocardioidaceae bacterium]